jgi:hypothetical protein
MTFTSGVDLRTLNSATMHIPNEDQPLPTQLRYRLRR